MEPGPLKTGLGPSRRVTSTVLLMLPIASVRPADAERSGIRGTFFDLISNPWEESADLEDEAVAARFITDGLLVIEDGKILAFGKFSQVAPQYPDLQITEIKERLITPGFIDGHTHFPQTRVIGAYGKHLLEWLNDYIFPEEARYFDPHYARVGATKFVRDCLASGTTTFQAFTTTREVTTIALFEESKKYNMRVIAGITGIDRNAPDYYRDTPQSFYDRSKKMIDRYHGKDRLLYAITPRFAFGSSGDQLAMCQRLKKEHPDCWVNTHMSETIAETEGVLRYFPDCLDYLAVYEKYDLVGPKFSAGHSIWMSESAFQRLHDKGGCAVFCPCSNLWLGSGLFQLGNATNPRRPIRIAIGTDIGAGNTCSLLRVMNDSYKVGMLNNSVYSGIHSPADLDPKRAERNKVSPYRAFYLATLGGARALYLDEWLGNFEVGKEADFVVIDFQSGPAEQPWLMSRSNMASQGEPGAPPTAKQIQGRPFPTTKDECAAALLALIAVGDSRSVDETWVFGQKVYDRDASTDFTTKAASRDEENASPQR